MGTPGIKQPDAENEASKSLDGATFSLGETKDRIIAPCKMPGEASGSLHLTRKSWADISSDEDADGEIAACALQSQSVKFSDDMIEYVPHAKIYPKHPPKS